MTRILSVTCRIATACALLAPGLAHAQLTVNAQTNLEQLARTITGPGVAISNPQINCHPEGYGQFQYSGSLLGIDEGILLTSGTISNAVGPNNVENKTFQQDRSGSSILNTVSGKTTRDACTFEFDVIPAGDSLRFDFVFGSEEYNEYVGSQYNDVFGFFISGPGIAGDPGIGNDKNIALVPGSNQAVTINNVNNGSNSSYYFDNAGGPYVQYDGFTQGLSAFSEVQPCQSYHLKLIVADASDRKFDSGVFIAKVKSNPVTMQLITANGTDSLIEGCNDGVVRFTRQHADNQPLALEYYLHGTAVNGTDYQPIGNPSPSVPKLITIPANQTYVDQPVTTIIDGADEGLETLLFILGNPNCPGSNADTLVVALVDSLNASVNPLTGMMCTGGQVQLSATGGTSYSWSPATGLSSTTVANPVAQPGATTTYTVTVTDGACSRQLHTQVKVSNMQASAVITKPLCNGAGNGAINLSISGGIPPYGVQWTGPNGFSATTEDISNIPAGTYTVVITDATCSRNFSFNVGQPAMLGVTLTPSLLIFGQNISCSGGNDGSINAQITGGTGPYSAAWSSSNGFTSNSVNIANLGEGDYSLVVTDANGCMAEANTTLLASAPMAAEITDTTHVACHNDGIGSATVGVSGGMPGYNYAWNTSPGQTTPTATGLAPGTYQVVVTDQYGCPAMATVAILGPTQPLSTQLTAQANVTCHGAANGSASISVSGGTSPYDIAWNTVPVQTGPSASSLAGGTYTATITDANGCQTTRAVTIAEPAQVLSASITAHQDINCHGQATGSATVNASGGTGPYSYSWNTMPPHNGASASGLAAGTYTVTATDAQGCSTSVTVVIAGPAAALAASVSSTNVSCAGGNNGTATVEAGGGTGPYSYQWNTTPAQHSATATGLGAGSWQAMVQDAQGCSTTATVVITQPVALVVTGIVTPAQCQGALNGAVDLQTSGGVEPYTWAWTGPNGFTASSEDIASVAAGAYSVVVTDANGCTASRSFSVVQPGLFTVNADVSTYGNANVSCVGSSDGTIDLDVSGAVPPYSFAWSGPNGFTSDQEDLSNLHAGTYQVSITDDNGCSTGLDLTLDAPMPISVQLATSNFGGYGVSCHGGSNGSITSQTEGGNAPYGTVWTGPGVFTSNDANISGVTAGAYQLTITDANGCSTTQSTTLSQPAALVAANGGSSPAGCFGSPTGQATVTVSGGAAPYNYTWNTSPAQHAATAMGLAMGTYTVSVGDANGCTAQTTIGVGGPASALIVSITSVGHVLCHGSNGGSATAEATGGTAPYSYTWNTAPPTSGATATGLAAGTWTVTVTDAAGCTATRNAVVNQPAQPLAATWADQHNVTCFGDQDGSASIQVTGGSGNYNITWSTAPVQYGSTINGMSAGMYTATIADQNGCPQTLPFTVYIGGPSEALSVAWTAQTYPGGAHVSCPGSTDGSINITPSGGTPNYTYYWQDGFANTFTTEDLVGLGAGTFQLHLLDAHGCALDTAITLAAPVQISATATVQSAVCHGSNDGAIDMTPAGGVPPYSYQWSGPNGYSATSQDLAQLYAGVYSVLITDLNGCTFQQPFDVTEPGTFTFDGVLDGNSCTSSSDGGIQLTASGGTEPYDFQWTGPNGYSATTESISGLAGGTYHLVLTDDNGCSALYSATVDAPEPLTVFSISHKNHGGYDITCAGASDGMLSTTYSGGVPPYAFTWTGPGGFTANTPDLTGLVAGMYSLTVSDANGCTRTIQVELTAPPPLGATSTAFAYAGGFGTSCSGSADGSITLVPEGGAPPYSVSWSGPGGYSASSWQITGLQAGSYTATVTDGNGCTTTATATLDAPAPITLAQNTVAIQCNAAATGAIDLTPSGGSGTYTYQWTGPGAFASNLQDLTGLQAGIYTVEVADANGCTATAAIELAQPLPILPVATITTTQCQGANTGAVDLNVTGGTGSYTYLWTGFPAFSATTADISGLFAGVYTVTITDDAGCTATASYNVGEPGQFDISAELSLAGGGYHVSCSYASDGAIDATVTGGTGPYNYFWTGPNGFTSIDEDPGNLAPGSYALTVHDVNGCNAGANFTLVAPTSLQIGLVATAQPSCNGGNNGSIQSSFSGGVAPFTATWTGPNGPMGIAPDLTGLGAGTYAVELTDALGCSATASITLTSPAGIDATATAHVFSNGTNLSCASAADGSINLTIDGGTAPYQIAWSGPGGYSANGPGISALPPGLYTATITDANGCTGFSQTTLTAPQPLVLTLTTSTYSNGNTISCAGANDGSATAVISGGSPDYTLQWTGPVGFSSSSSTITDLAPGAYTAYVADASGCTASVTVNLAAPPPLVVNATLSDHSGFEVGCTGGDGAIDLNLSGGLAPYQVSWTGPNGFASSDEDLTSLNAGMYTSVISDANGCTTSRNFTLNAPEALVATLSVTSNECDAASNGEIDLGLVGGVAPFTITWTGPGGFTSSDEDISGLASGEYSVSITSATGCSTSAQATVTAAAPMELSLYASDYGQVNIPCHGGSTGMVELTVTGGFGPLDIAWSGPGGFSASTSYLGGLTAGTYSAVITDAHGCMRDTSITLTEPDSPLDASLTSTDILCHGTAEGSITTTVSGGNGPYSFDWRGPDSTAFSTQDINALPAGDYELVVTDANQCVDTLQATIHQPDSALAVEHTLSGYNGYNISCANTANGGIDLHAIGGTPGYTYVWNGPNGFNSPADTLGGLAAGTYILDLSDANGCTLHQEFTLNPPPPLTINLAAGTFPSGSTISCQGANDGSITATVAGGVEPLSLQWTGPNGFTSSTAAIADLGPGTYCLMITDANNCDAQACLLLEEPNMLTATATSAPAACGLATGSVDATVVGGGAPYSFAWSNAATTEDIVGVAEGEYTLVVADANGCSTTTAATVGGSPALEALATTTAPLCHTSRDGAIALEVTSGTAPFSFQWSNDSTSAGLNQVGSGNYTVTITDANNCTWVQTIALNAPPALHADTVLSHISTYGGSDGSIALHAGGGTPPYSYAWNDGASSDPRNGLAAGTYTVTITDANGCTLELVIHLTQPDALDMPTGFTPNGDGHNDTFIVRGIDGFPNNQLTVFNRWGNVVFDQLRYNNDWRGENQQGQALPNGTYFVVLRLTPELILQNYVDLRR
ncbi:MAG TPA: choice-of-anchor L domain-containing protein [Flavobacteriales bacterium]|nr:choice-of-anchor L domain-containing protein [Flavobacteriales bacterium]